MGFLGSISASVRAFCLILYAKELALVRPKSELTGPSSRYTRISKQWLRA